MRSRFNWLGLMLGAWLTLAQLAAAQQPAPAPATPAPDTSSAPQAPAAPPAPAPQTPAPQTPTSPTAATTPTKPAAAAWDPSRTDQTYQLEVDYWLSNGTPSLKGGKQFPYAGGSVLNYPGKTKNSFAASLVIPLPSRSDIKVSAFQLHGNGTTTNEGDVTYFGVPFSPGDFLSPSYTLKNLRVSYEYLSLPWPPETKKWRLYTLYEIQYTNMKTVINAPFKSNVDLNGNAVTTFATGSHFIVYPTFGLKLEYPVSKSFRIEMEGSGFGWPHHAGQWNAEITAAYHITNHLEARFGYKAFYYKTSPQSTEYFSQTVYGAYVGLRYSLKPFTLK